MRDNVPEIGAHFTPPRSIPEASAHAPEQRPSFTAAQKPLSPAGAVGSGRSAGHRCARRKFRRNAQQSGSSRTTAYECRSSETDLRSSETALGRTAQEEIILMARTNRNMRKSSRKKASASRPSGAGRKIVPLATMEKQAIANSLQVTNDDKLKAARLLGIGKTTLYRKLKEYGW